MGLWNQYCQFFSDLGDGWNVALLETEEEYYFISVNDNSLEGDTRYFIGGLLNDEFFYQYPDDYGFEIYGHPFYSIREGGNGGVLILNLKLD